MALPKILDDALDTLVVPGFSRIGYLVRAGQFAPLDHNALRGKTVVITGPTSGLGRAAAHQLAAMGAPAEISSSAVITRSISGRPAPPNSFGHVIPIRPSLASKIEYSFE